MSQLFRLKTDVEILIETIHKVIIKAKKFIIKDAK